MGKTVAFVLKDRKVIKEMTVNRVKVNQAKMVRMDMHHKFQKMVIGLFGMLNLKSL